MPQTGDPVADDPGHVPFGGVTASDIERWLLLAIADLTGDQPGTYSADTEFTDVGLSSMDAVVLTGQLQDYLGEELSPTLAWDYPNPRALAQHLAGTGDEAAGARPLSAVDDGPVVPVAVVGMACRFPGAPSVDAFWSLLDLEQDGLAVQHGRDGSRPHGLLPDIDQFDAGFFAISEAEAAHVDPQQRLLLESSWEALEDAAIAPNTLAGSRTGVFVGISGSDYAHLQLADPALRSRFGGTGQAVSIAANRLSYLLDLRGPSLSIDTACSSSLVAVHLALRSLRCGESDLALAGGVNVLLEPEITEIFAAAGTMAANGRCKTFDSTADGYVRSEGCGLIVLKRLTDALADGDSVLGVIAGSAIGQEGRTNGLSAPSGAAQQTVLREALRDARLEPGDVGYVEAHGTGTALGDPIEVAALSTVFTAGRGDACPLLIGSVKANIGHAEAAAGIAGLIKVLLMLRHRRVPGQIHLQELNPQLPAGAAASIPRTSREWAGEPGRPLTAGVSSFGFGGTISHVIVQEPPAAADPAPGLPAEPAHPRPCHLLALSAASETAVAALAGRYATLLRDHPGADLGAMARTTTLGRGQLRHRAAVVATSHADAVAGLQSLAGGAPEAGSPAAVYSGPTAPPGRLAMLFSGGGSQYINMGRELYVTNALFRDHLRHCQELLSGCLDVPLLSVLFPLPSQRDLCDRIRYMQPALVAVGYALAQVWQSWGVAADLVLGHSTGEFTAACVAGALDLGDALRLVAERGRLIEELCEPGSMAVVFGAEDVVRDVAAQMPAGRAPAVAAVNAPGSVVVAGRAEDLACLVAKLSEQGVASRPLKVGHAFHSPMMQPAAEPFARAARGLAVQDAAAGIVSDLDGRLFGGGYRPDAGYWVRQLTEPVRFADGVRLLAEQGCSQFLEVGPGRALVAAGQQILPEAAWIPSMRPGLGNWNVLTDAVGRLYAAGRDIDWRQFHHGSGHSRLPIPSYPFERQRHWLPTGGKPAAGAQPAVMRPGSARPGGFASAPDVKSNAVLPADDAPTRDGGMPRPQTAKPDAAAYTKAEPGIEAVLAALSRLLARQLGRQAAADPHRPFLELGADSLTLFQLLQAVQETFGVTIPVASLFEDMNTLTKLATHIHATAPPSALAALPAPPRPAAPPQQPGTADADRVPDLPRAVAGEPGIEQFLQVHAQVMNQAYELLRGGPAAENARAAGSAPAAGTAKASSGTHEAGAGRITLAAKDTFIAFRPDSPGGADPLTGTQTAFARQLIQRYTARTRRSKELAGAERRWHSDVRHAPQPFADLNQIKYPVVVQRSLGSRIWDVDGNEYTDLTMGFGVNLFGHQEPFIVSAVTSQLAEGIQLGPHTPLAAEVAELICDLTGQQRVVFCNTGSEAVMVALRLARAVTGRRRIALFAGSYHGSADPVLARQNIEMASGESVPMAPGITEDVSRNVLVLPYGSDDSLDVLRAHTDELAAVLVEPVQSRRPDLQPVEFLRRLRELTLAGGVPLIFDEMVTGFRSHPGGVRGLFGIDADITTYGKILGGGLPIGVVAGDASYLDAIDGGAWQFDDAHHIPSVRTFFTGTFAKHPLALAAARAVLTELKSRGPGLQDDLGRRTAGLTRRLNTALETAGVAVRVAQFSSMFRFGFPGEPPWSRNAELFYTALLDRGLYLWEGRTCFLSTAHTDADLDKIVSAVTHTAAELAAAGVLLAQPTPPAPVADDAAPQAAARDAVPVQSWPLSRAQQEMWLLTQLGSDQSRAYNEGVLLDMRGELDLTALRWAVTQMLARHDSLHAVIDSDGAQQRRVPALAELPLVDFAGLPEPERPRRLTAWLEAQAGEVYDLTVRPPVRASILRLAADHHQLYIGVHHVMVDGWSFGVMVTELAELYDARLAGRSPALPEPVPYAEHVAWEQRRETTPGWQADAQYWQEQYADGVPDLVLPADYPVPRAAGHRLGTITKEIAGDIADRLPSASSELGVTQFGLLLAAYAYLLHQLSRQDDLVVAVPFARRGYPGGERVVGNCSTVLPVRSRLSAGARVRDYVRTLQHTLICGHKHSDFSIAALRQHTSVGDGAGGRIFAAAFNQDRASAPAHLGGLRVSLAAPPGRFAKTDLIFDVLMGDGDIRLTVAYDAELFRPATVDRYAGMFEHLLHQFIADPDALLDRVGLASAEVLDPMPWHGGAPASAPSSAPASTGADPLTLPALVERQTGRSPGATAVCQGDASLSYAELNTRANRLARHLVELGAGPERTVTLAAPPDASLIAGLLAVLKTGAAYHVLDTGQPPTELASVLACVRPDLILATRAVAGLPEVPAATLVLLDDPATQARISTADDTDLTDAGRREPLLPGHPALVLCSPGPDGQPCATAISHAAVMNLLSWCQNELSLTQQDRVLSGPLAAFEPLRCWPLGAGGAIVMGGPGEAAGPGDVAGLIQQTGTTAALLSPAALGDLLATSQARPCPSLRHLVCGGGPLPPGLAGRCGQTLDADLIVLHQPTGAPACPTARRSRPGQPDDATSIGRPIWNTSVYLLDRCLRPVPPGVVGELCIAGAGLPRGYHRRAALTAGHFVAVPFGAPGERMHRTGALARWSDDGALLLAGQEEEAQVAAAVAQMGAGEIEAALRMLPV